MFDSVIIDRFELYEGALKAASSMLLIICCKPYTWYMTYSIRVIMAQKQLAYKFFTYACHELISAVWIR